MNYIDYTLTLEGQELTGSKIVIPKYSNLVYRINIESEEEIDGRMYLAMLNPITKKYTFLPAVDGRVIIDTNVTVYPGKWTLLVVILDDSYELVDGDIDQRLFTFVSTEFKKFFVIDNFLAEDEVEKQDMATIENALDNFAKAQTGLINAEADAWEAVSQAQEILEQMQGMYDTARTNVILQSSTGGSTRRFRLRVNDSGNLYTELIE